MRRDSDAAAVTDTGELTAADELAAADELVDTEPQAALRVAERHLRSDDATVRLLARRIAAYAARELHHIEDSSAHFEAAIELVEPDSAEASRLLLSVAGNHALAGRFKEAHDILDRLVAVDAVGADRHLIAIQRASIFHIEDRLVDAIGIFETMLAEDTALDLSLRAHVHGNLGSSLMQLGRFVEGRDHLQRALHAYRDAGETRPQLDVLSNLALSEAWAQNVPVALARFASAKELAEQLGVDDAITRLDEARALVEAGLGGEAVEAATAAADRFERGGTAAWLGEAHLVRALALLVIDRPAEATDAARLAADKFEQQGRSTSALFAQKSAFIAAWAGGAEDDYDAAARTAEQLDDGEFHIDAQELWSKLALTAFARGALDVAGRAAQRCVAGPGVAPTSQLRRSIAAAIELLIAGRDNDALAELRRGVDVLNRHRLTLGATELRARSSNLGADLSRLALRTAFGTGEPAEVWTWSEALRANTLNLRPDATGRDPDVIEALAALRSASSAARTSGDQAAVERARLGVTSLVRSRRPVTTGARSDRGADSLPDCGAPIPDSTSFVELDGWLHRIDVDLEGALRLVARQARLDHVADALERVHRGWRRWLRLRSAEAAPTVARSLRSALEDLDGLLGLQPRGGHHFVAVSDSLHGVPWSALPSLSTTAVAVAPTAALASPPDEPAVSEGPTAGGTGALIVAGPGLEFADAEVLAISAAWPDAVVHGSANATANAVLAAMSERRVAHIAAHGTFRHDNPMFSSLELSDGPLTVLDLEQINTPPAVVVLSACDAGLPAVFGSNETLGMVAALLAVGCRSVIGPVVSIPDAACTPVMVELHERLAAHIAPASALRSAINSFEPGSPEAMLASTLVCFGAG